MPSTDKTPVLGLNQWSLGDYPHFDDHNADNALLDAAQAANATQFADIGAQLDNKATVSFGTWIPTIYGTVTEGNPTYLDSHRFGYYAMIDNLLYVYCSIVIRGKGGMAGNIQIRGLPNSVFVSFSAPLSVIYGNAALSTGNILGASILVDKSITLRKVTPASSYERVIHAEITDNFELTLSGFAVGFTPTV